MGGPPLIVHACNCCWCQRETGSAFTLNAVIEADRDVLLHDEPDAVRGPSASGRRQIFARCRACRSAA
jgi:hypothetical protein